MRWYTTIAIVAGVGSTAFAATSTRSVPSVFGGNGHNASFDGRLYIVRTGPGWQAHVLRPEGITYAADGLPDATGPMWSAPLQILAGEPHGENALAICESDPASAPFACDDANQPSAGGPFSCYDVWVFDADASRSVAQGGQSFRRRGLLLRVADPGTASARPVDFRWGDIEPLTTAGAGALHGDRADTHPRRQAHRLEWLAEQRKPERPDDVFGECQPVRDDWMVGAAVAIAHGP